MCQCARSECQAARGFRIRPLNDFLPTYEFSERHGLEIDAEPARIDRALREVSLAEIPVARALVWLRSLGRRRSTGGQPFLELALQSAVLLEDTPGEGVVLGLTGQFWRLRSTPDPGRPRAVPEFLVYDRPDVCKAVFDFRITELRAGCCRLSTETRVHVEDPAARRAFRRYWLIIKPFSGLTRILFLRAARRRAERQAREM
jgi:hypothetical protein